MGFSSFSLIARGIFQQLSVLPGLHSNDKICKKNPIAFVSSASTLPFNLKTNNDRTWYKLYPRHSEQVYKMFRDKMSLNFPTIEYCRH